MTSNEREGSLDKELVLKQHTYSTSEAIRSSVPMYVPHKPYLLQLVPHRKRPSKLMPLAGNVGGIAQILTGLLLPCL
jgi:hypothetical protein